MYNMLHNHNTSKIMLALILMFSVITTSNTQSTETTALSSTTSATKVTAPTPTAPSITLTTKVTKPIRTTPTTKKPHETTTMKQIEDINCESSVNEEFRGVQLSIDDDTCEFTPEAEAEGYTLTRSELIKDAKHFYDSDDEMFYFACRRLSISTSRTQCNYGEFLSCERLFFPDTGHKCGCNWHYALLDDTSNTCNPRPGMICKLDSSQWFNVTDKNCSDNAYCDVITEVEKDRLDDNFMGMNWPEPVTRYFRDHASGICRCKKGHRMNAARQCVESSGSILTSLHIVDIVNLSILISILSFTLM